MSNVKTNSREASLTVMNNNVRIKFEMYYDRNKFLIEREIQFLLNRNNLPNYHFALKI